jgi:hypothetical protein
MRVDRKKKDPYFSPHPKGISSAVHPRDELTPFLEKYVRTVWRGDGVAFPGRIIAPPVLYINSAVETDDLVTHSWRVGAKNMV